MSKVIKPAKRNGLPGENDGVPQGASGGPVDQEFMSLDNLWGDVPRTGIVDSLTAIKRKREQVARELDTLIRKAKEEAARIEREAYEKGYSQGEKDGMAFGKKKFEVAIHQFENLLTDIQRQREELLRRYEDDIVAMIKLMTERLVFQQVSVHPEIIRAAVQAAMKFVVDNSMVRVHLHPDDFVLFKDVELDGSIFTDSMSRIELAEDPGISVGGCFLTTDFGEVDATLENRRNRLYEALDKAYLEGKKQ